MPNTPVLTATEVGFRYQPRGRQVLQAVSLTLLPGTLTVLLGPNASGKSTLIKCLAGIHRPTSGRVHVEADNIASLSARQIAARIAYAPQTVSIPFAFTVGELLDMQRTTQTVHPSQATTELLETFDLGGMLLRSLLSLSGGERQRVIAARAFAQNTPILLLDEPTAHLDLRHQVTLMEAARNKARQGTAVCVVLHDLNLAATFADTLVLLHDGKVAASGSVAEVLQLSTLNAVYHAAIQLVTGPDGTPVVLPVSGIPDTPRQDLTVS